MVEPLLRLVFTQSAAAHERWSSKKAVVACGKKMYGKFALPQTWKFTAQPPCSLVFCRKILNFHDPPGKPAKKIAQNIRKFRVFDRKPTVNFHVFHRDKVELGILPFFFLRGDGRVCVTFFTAPHATRSHFWWRESVGACRPIQKSERLYKIPPPN